MKSKKEYRISCCNCKKNFKYTNNDFKPKETNANFLKRCGWVFDKEGFSFCCKHCEIVCNLDTEFWKNLSIGFIWVNLKGQQCIILDAQTYAYQIAYKEWIVEDLWDFLCDYPEESICLKKCWDEHCEKQ
jgi:hypothetical protein